MSSVLQRAPVALQRSATERGPPAAAYVSKAEALGAMAEAVLQQVLYLLTRQKAAKPTCWESCNFRHKEVM